jgi:hypothetical protein
MTIGMSARQRLVFIAPADRGEDPVRIISARLATRGETHAYQERSRKQQWRPSPRARLVQADGRCQGKYYERATAGTTLVLLEPDVAEAFPDGRTVNQALRALIKVAQAQVGAKRSGSKPPVNALQPPSRARESRPRSKKRTRAARG